MTVLTPEASLKAVRTFVSARKFRDAGHVDSPNPDRPFGLQFGQSHGHLSRFFPVRAMSSQSFALASANAASKVVAASGASVRHRSQVMLKPKGRDGRIMVRPLERDSDRSGIRG
jgi:hypothetical protein